MGMGHIGARGIGESPMRYPDTVNVALFFFIAGYIGRSKPTLSFSVGVNDEVSRDRFFLSGSICCRASHRPPDYALFVQAAPDSLRDSPGLSCPRVLQRVLEVSSRVHFRTVHSAHLLQSARGVPVAAEHKNLPEHPMIVTAVLVVSILFQQSLPGRRVLAINVLRVAVAFMAS